MSDQLKNQAEQLGGKAKEAAGDVTGNERLENEGRADQTVGGIKEKVVAAAGAGLKRVMLPARNRRSPRPSPATRSATARA